MTKLLATLIAAVFFSVSMGSVAIAASPEGGAPKAEGSAPKAQAKKKSTAKKPAKAKKSAKSKKTENK